MEKSSLFYYLIIINPDIYFKTLFGFLKPLLEEWRQNFDFRSIRSNYVAEIFLVFS